MKKGKYLSPIKYFINIQNSTIYFLFTEMSAAINKFKMLILETNLKSSEGN